MRVNDRCLLCGIRDGEPAVRKLYEDDLVYAIDVPEESQYFRGPVHFLVIPNRHVQSALFLTDGDAAVAGRSSS
jgi:histidine triad (HIT) family protein